jgi:hypothetical protein
MKMKWLTIIWMITFLIVTGISQSDAQIKPINTNTIKRSNKELDYKKTKQVWSLKETPSKPSTTKMPAIRRNKTEGLGKFLELISYVLIGALILLLLYSIVKNIKLKKSSQAASFVDLDKIDDIQSLDLASMLRNALQNADFKLALRLRFLMVLQQLQSKNLISWKSEKTNRAYVRELAHTRYGDSFGDLSYIFENSWYGNQTVDQSRYNYFDQKYSDISKSIANGL